MKYPDILLRKTRGVWDQAAARPAAVIVGIGGITTLAYILFMILPFFIPETDRSNFPPYLALPQTGFRLSDYYVLYLFIFLNVLLIFSLYLMAFRATGTISIETGAEDRLRLTRAITIFSALFHFMMLLTPFLLSTDIFDYIRHGRILAIYGENPLVVPATYFPQDPFFSLGGWVGTGSVYGSLHVYITAMLARLAGDGFAANFFLFKGFFIGLDLVNVWLIWRLAARLHPGMENRALLFYGWNPFILTIVVANAHNDILMLTLVLAGFLLYLDKRLMLGALCLTLATLVKFITLPILLVYIALAIRKQQGWPRRLGTGAGLLGISGGAMVLSYLPLWAGRETFSYLATVGQKTNFTLSALIRDAAASHFQLSLSNTIVQFSLGALLAAYLLWQIRGVKDTEGLLSAAAGLAFLTPLALFWFQPWYLTLALGLVALRPWRHMLAAALVFSISVMFFDSFWWHAPVSMDIQKPLRVLVVFGLPIILLAWLKGREVLPATGRRLIDWSLSQAAASRQPGRISDPSPLRLVVEIGVLAVAAVVPMAIIITTSPHLKNLAELLLLRLRLVFG